LVPWVVGAVIVSTLAMGAVAVAQIGARSVVVPGVIGRTEATARKAIDAAGLDLAVSERRSADDPAGIVLDQNPEPGGWVRENARVRVVLSAGPEPIAVPNLVHKKAEGALVALRDAGLIADVAHSYDEQIPAGRVVSQRPAPGEKIPPESKVTIVVSDGHAPVTVPSVAGLTWEAANQALVDAHLRPGKREEFSDDVEIGLVTRVEPAEGSEAPYDSAVAVYVSKGPDLVDVPDVVGMKVDEAYKALQEAGLRASLPLYKPGAKVTGQDPGAYERVRRGSTVTLTV